MKGISAYVSIIITIGKFSVCLDLLIRELIAIVIYLHNSSIGVLSITRFFIDLCVIYTNRPNPYGNENNLIIAQTENNSRYVFR